QHYNQIHDHYAYPYEKCQNQFDYEAYQEQADAYDGDNYVEDVVLLEKIQKMEADMVQLRETVQMRAFSIGCRAPCPWEGPFPRHYSPQEKLDFMIEMLPQLAQWTVEIGAYEKSVGQPCQW
ncbi:hypothetical protein KI387_044500, partial [Taxus chinensis]